MNIKQLLEIENVNLKDIKIHLASGSQNRREALNEYYNDTFQKWQEWQNSKNFERDYIISLAQITNEEWLFIGIYKKLDVVQQNDGYHYSTELTSLGNELIGRLKIQFNKYFRQSYVLAENYIDNMKAIEILREKMIMDNFPGYENVHIDFRTLQTIIRIQEKSWYTALKTVTGVYLITDGNNGKLYIGSATGSDNFWQRWSNYAKNFHGGNFDLKKLKEEHEDQYFDRIYYSILEIYNNKTEQQFIWDREYFWQKILKTQEFGYNKGKKSNNCLTSLSDGN